MPCANATPLARRLCPSMLTGARQPDSTQGVGRPAGARLGVALVGLDVAQARPGFRCWCPPPHWRPDSTAPVRPKIQGRKLLRVGATLESPARNCRSGAMQSRNPVRVAPRSPSRNSGQRPQGTNATRRASPVHARRAGEVQTGADAMHSLANMVMAWNTSQKRPYRIMGQLTFDHCGRTGLVGSRHCDERASTSAACCASASDATPTKYCRHKYCRQYQGCRPRWTVQPCPASAIPNCHGNARRRG